MWAQEIKVVDCYILPNDKTAEENPRLDGNGDPCALLKIKTNDIQGLTFPNRNQYQGEAEYNNGIYYVYIPMICHRLTFAHSDYQQGVIDMSEFGYKKNIKGGKTYEIVLEAPKAIKGNYVSIKVAPVIAGCKVVFDGNASMLPDNGIVEFTCSPGSHRYRVEAANYEAVNGSVTVTDGVVPVSVQLQPTTVPVTFKCNVDANVYVDDINYGKVGLLNIPIGDHKIRLVCKGYKDYESSLSINSDVPLLSFEMEKNKGKQIDIHPVKVTIHCKTESLYKNNKKMDDWHGSGSVILLMPYSKCRISDDYGNGAILTVGREDMTISMENGVITKMSPEKHSSVIEKKDYNTAYKTNTIGGGKTPEVKLTSQKSATPVNSSQQTSSKPVMENADKGEIYEVAENQPVFPGGKDNLMQWLSTNLKYPASAQENGTQGRVVVEFVVNKDGTISEAKVVKSVDPALDKEAVRLIYAMPNWKPGTMRGKAVRVRYTQPITFRLQ